MNLYATSNRADKAEMRRLIERNSQESELFALVSLIFQALGYSSMVGNLYTILGSEGLMKLSKAYGGQKLRVPTRDQILRALKLVKLIYCFDFEGKSFSKSMEEAGFQKGDRINCIRERKRIVAAIQHKTNS